MYRDISKPPPPLPSPDLTELDEGIHLLKPLSRRGEGPGVILVTPDYVGQLTITNGVPSPILKWAEEGYVVAEVQESALRRRGSQAITMALEAIATCDKCDSRPVGLVGKTTLPPLFFSFRQLLTCCSISARGVESRGPYTRSIRANCRRSCIQPRRRRRCSVGIYSGSATPRGPR